jgi:hypothetical protein
LIVPLTATTRGSTATPPTLVSSVIAAQSKR